VLRLTVLSFALLFVHARASALDKQGSAHGGSVEGADSGVRIAASLMLGAALYNPAYAARPDNTGLALMRYAGHRDVDLIGSRLSIPIDINTFTDREVYLLGSLSFSLFDSTERDAREGAGD
jgi:hypothetical protein